MTCVPFFLE